MSTILLLLSLFAARDYPQTKGFSDIPIQRFIFSSRSSKLSFSFSPRENNHPTDSVDIRSSLLFSTVKNVKEIAPKGSASTSRERNEQWHWVEDSNQENLLLDYRNDDIDYGDRQGGNSNSEKLSKIRFKIHGNPRPLQRHRSSRGHIYNPSLKYQKSFLNAFQNLIFDEKHHMNMNMTMDHNDDTPLFDATENLVITIIFRMKRPKSHFVNNKPGPGRLKKKAPSQLSPIRTDVDNLAKFVLDSMNGVLYEDDRQITSIHATKILDDADLCEGSTEIYIRSINEEDIKEILESSISIIDNDHH